MSDTTNRKWPPNDRGAAGLPRRDARAASGHRLPRHVAIIMDGNGRWASARRLPRYAGHKAGAESVRRVVNASAEYGIKALTLFAFSSENWRRPSREVSMLMGLFVATFEREAQKLHENNVRVRVIGDRSAFSDRLRTLMTKVESLTRANSGLNLVIAANYGGRWDLTEAARKLARCVARGEISSEEITPDILGSFLSTSGLPDPDLLIRTGHEKRVSNFLLWQLAYAELYFTDTLWPDFDGEALTEALAAYAGRQRRFGGLAEASGAGVSGSDDDGKCKDLPGAIEGSPRLPAGSESLKVRATGY